MEQTQAIAKAKQFAQTAYASDLETIVRDTQEKLAKVRAGMLAKGHIGAFVSETARIRREQIMAAINAKLNGLLEGYELHGVEVDDEIKAGMVEEAIELWNIQVNHAQQAFPNLGGGSVPDGLQKHYTEMVAQNGISISWARTKIDRWRLMKKQKIGSAPVFNLQDNSRINIRSNDHSVNVVNKSSVFEALRGKITSEILDREQAAILEKLNALEYAQDAKTLAARYGSFMGAIADHMAVLGPFLPGLSDWFHQALKALG